MMTQYSIKKVITFVAVSVLFVSCAPPRSLYVEKAAENIPNVLGCPEMKSLVFDAFYEMIDQGQAVPAQAEMKEILTEKMNQLKTERHLSVSEAEIVDKITAELSLVVDLMLEQTPNMTMDSWKEQIQKIIEFEMQDRSSAEIIAHHTRLHQALNRIQSLSAEGRLSCSINTPFSENPSPAVPLEAASVGLTTGVNRVLATAYQSCRATTLPVMSRSTASVEGVSIVGKHSDQIGSKRMVTNLKSLQKTHYYLKDVAYEATCTDVSKNPLIYDYGGSPAVSGSTLNFFKDAGTGTSVLGVDCSAFVSAAVAVVGFRYKPDLANKPIYVRQSSSKFISAAKSGFTCFDNVMVNAKQSIVAGDIVGVKGHVVIVDRVGKDPFGLNAVKNQTGCSALNYKNFDIDVAQSSPSKGGVGLNKYTVSDYLDETSKMRTAFVEMGKQACLAKFQNKSIKPTSTEWGFLRHKGTPECMAPRVALTGESCVKQCF